MKKFILVFMVVSLLAAGCAQQQRPTKESQGALLGAILGGVAGGLAGAQFGKGSGKTAAAVAGALGGALLGGAIGTSIGKNMDDTDRLMTARALEKAPTGQDVAWHNPDTGRSYDVTPTKTYESPKEPGRYCREYTTSVEIGGETQKAYGTACRQPDGTWQIVGQGDTPQAGKAEW
ncbi:MAG: glycine zipper 2TM domain-containing protein [Desulfovibrionaceae bacterium]|nr:glycine zipper 2TM domain-containing protein [Desulfovibrionaceae bacterium]